MNDVYFSVRAKIFFIFGIIIIKKKLVLEECTEHQIWLSAEYSTKLLTECSAEYRIDSQKLIKQFFLLIPFTYYHPLIITC